MDFSWRQSYRNRRGPVPFPAHSSRRLACGPKQKWLFGMPFDIGVTHCDNPGMNATLTLDKAGRVVIPKALRDALRLEAGDELALSAEGDSFTLRPIRVAARLKGNHGIWVFGGKESITAAETDAVMSEIREQRAKTSRGDRL